MGSWSSTVNDPAAEVLRLRWSVVPVKVTGGVMNWPFFEVARAEAKPSVRRVRRWPLRA